MRTGIEPTNDFAFKYVFGIEERTDSLKSLVNSVITDSGGIPMQQLQLLNPFSIKEGASDRVGILDIRASDDSGRESLVEMQMAAHVFFAERIVWYTAKHYDQQLQQGERYTALRPVVMVCFINDVLFDDDSGQYHWCFQLIDKDSGRQLTDQFVIHIVELGKFHKTLDELVTELDRWAYFLKHGAQLDPHNLPSQLQNDGIVEAVKGLEMLSLDEQKRDEYLRRRVWEMDLQAHRDGASIREQRGEQRGELRGRTEGRAEGVLASLLRVGTRKFGVPSPEVLAQLNAIKSVSELDVLMDRLLEISTWRELFMERSDASETSGQLQD